MGALGVLRTRRECECGATGRAGLRLSCCLVAWASKQQDEAAGPLPPSAGCSRQSGPLAAHSALHLPALSCPASPGPAPPRRPDGRQWLKFDDERVEKVDPARAIDENFGGEDERQPPGGERARSGALCWGCMAAAAPRCALRVSLAPAPAPPAKPPMCCRKLRKLLPLTGVCPCSVPASPHLGPHPHPQECTQPASHLPTCARPPRALPSIPPSLPPAARPRPARRPPLPVHQVRQRLHAGLRARQRVGLHHVRGQRGGHLRARARAAQGAPRAPRRAAPRPLRCGGRRLLREAAALLAGGEAQGRRVAGE